VMNPDAKPFMALGTPGNDGIWQRLVQVIVNVVDFGMDIQSAISAPRMIYGGPIRQKGKEPPRKRFEQSSSWVRRLQK
jgi:gamma-glutamyltranspeptidase